jgi:hypothetical protein
MALRQEKSIARRFWDAARFVLLLPFLPLVLALLVIGLIFIILNRIIIYPLIWFRWSPNGKDVLFVSSDSPIWHEYMQTKILPLVAERAIVLNWSERSKWSKLSLTVRVFRTFGGERDFNPMVVLFRPFQRAKVFRFLPALKEWKRGNAEDLEKLRCDLILAL